MAGGDRATAAILTLADVPAPAAGTEIVPVPALDGRWLTIEQADKRSRPATKKCLTGELRPSRSTAPAFAEIERCKARR